METGVVEAQDAGDVEADGEEEDQQVNAVLEKTQAQDFCLESITLEFLIKAHHSDSSDAPCVRSSPIIIFTVSVRRFLHVFP